MIFIMSWNFTAVEASWKSKLDTERNCPVGCRKLCVVDIFSSNNSGLLTRAPTTEAQISVSKTHYTASTSTRYTTN